MTTSWLQKKSIILFIIIFSFASCTTVKEYQKNKLNDARQAADHQCFGLPLLGLQTFINAPGLIAIGPPYPQPAGETKETAFRRYLDDVVM